jgi:Autophagy receptor ATG43
MPKRLPPSAIPDLRFEPTYLAKLEAADPGWRSVVWITIRDHAVNPLLQGALWYVALKALTAFLFS